MSEENSQQSDNADPQLRSHADTKTTRHSMKLPSPSGVFYHQPFDISRWWSQVLEKFLLAISASFHWKTVLFCVIGLLIQSYSIRGWAFLCRNFAGVDSIWENASVGPTKLGLLESSGNLGINGAGGPIEAWADLIGPCLSSIANLNRSVWAYGFLLLSLLLLGMWSWIGTYVSRRTALLLAEKKEIDFCRQYANQNFLRCWCGLLISITTGLFFVIPFSLVGVVFRETHYFSSVIWLLVSPFLILGSLILFVTTVAGVLFPAAVGVDRSDAFESISRCFSYFLARPFQFILMFFLLFVAASVIGIFLNFVLYGAQLWIVDGNSTSGAVQESLSFDQLVRQLNPTETSFFRWFWPSVNPSKLPAAVLGMFGDAVQLSLLFSLSTAVYLFLRQSKDEAPLEKIFLEGGGTLQEINSK